jgi:hypothetical protein
MREESGETPSLLIKNIYSACFAAEYYESEAPEGFLDVPEASLLLELKRHVHRWCSVLELIPASGTF